MAVFSISHSDSCSLLLLLQSPEKLLDNDPEFFHRFTIVIGVQLPERYVILFIDLFIHSFIHLLFIFNFNKVVDEKLCRNRKYVIQLVNKSRFHLNT